MLGCSLSHSPCFCRSLSIPMQSYCMVYCSLAAYIDGGKLKMRTQNERNRQISGGSRLDGGTSRKPPAKNKNTPPERKKDRKLLYLHTCGVHADTKIKIRVKIAVFQIKICCDLLPDIVYVAVGLKCRLCIQFCDNTILRCRCVGWLSSFYFCLYSPHFVVYLCSEHSGVASTLQCHVTKLNIQYHFTPFCFSRLDSPS